jgi:hypothetical protein
MEIIETIKNRFEDIIEKLSLKEFYKYRNKTIKIKQ